MCGLLGAGERIRTADHPLTRSFRQWWPSAATLVGTGFLVVLVLLEVRGFARFGHETGTRPLVATLCMQGRHTLSVTVAHLHRCRFRSPLQSAGWSLGDSNPPDPLLAKYVHAVGYRRWPGPHVFPYPS